MIKLIANLLVIAGICVGAVSATTAYRWSLDLPDEAFTIAGVGASMPASPEAASEADTGTAGDEIPALIDESGDDGAIPDADNAAISEADPDTGSAIEVEAVDPGSSESTAYVQLKANAGRGTDDAGNPTGEPIARASTLENPTPLTSELLSKLRAAGVEAVHVKTFHFGYWEHRWHFLASLVAVIVGGLTIRFTSRPTVETDEDGRRTAKAPIDHLREAEEALDTLSTGLRGLSSDSARCRAIMNELGDIIQTTLVEFVDTREVMIAKLGLGRFAQVMDSFAGAERTLNRAWSAASDGHEPEATECLHDGREMLAETAKMLERLS